MTATGVGRHLHLVRGCPPWCQHDDHDDACYDGQVVTVHNALTGYTDGISVRAERWDVRDGPRTIVVLDGEDPAEGQLTIPGDPGTLEQLARDLQATAAMLRGPRA